MIWLALSQLAWAAPAAPLGDVNAGAYIVRAAGCTDCHTSDSGKYMAGGVRLENQPFGVFYTPNITPDVETGIGRWTFKDFKRAIRWGQSPRHMFYYPIFPYRSYTKLTDVDIANMWAYFRSIPPVRRKNRNHALNLKLDNSLDSGPVGRRSAIWGWQFMAWGSGMFSTERQVRAGRGSMRGDDTKTFEWNRGAYLVEAAFHCTECHTPRHFGTGLLKTSWWMSGANYKLNGHRVPNITPDETTGLGHWTADTWDRFLRSGYKPDGQTPGYEMALVVQNTAALTPADRRAVITYLMSLTPVRSAYE